MLIQDVQLPERKPKLFQRSFHLRYDPERWYYGIRDTAVRLARVSCIAEHSTSWKSSALDRSMFLRMLRALMETLPGCSTSPAKTLAHSNCISFDETSCM